MVTYRCLRRSDTMAIKILYAKETANGGHDMSMAWIVLYSPIFLTIVGEKYAIEYTDKAEQNPNTHVRIKRMSVKARITSRCHGAGTG